MSEGPLFFIFTRDFQNVDLRRSETKELMSKKKTYHVRYKTFTSLSYPLQEEKTWNN